MANTPATTATTQATHQVAFPPFDTATFPSQLFWLVITFALLFVVLWKVAGPRISDTIAGRRDTINKAIEAARKARGDAAAAEAAYRTALAGARAHAVAMADKTRQTLSAEIAKAKADADAQAASVLAEADARINATRQAAMAQVQVAASAAVIAIVARLTGDTISPEDAVNAVKS
jgi:F-type H+-transporting ATPase subunit b